MSEIYKKLFEIKKANIKLQRDTKAYNYKYATLSQIQDKLSWEFEKQWLLITHSIVNNCVVTSIIEVESWEKIESSILMSENIKPQDKWSEITYYRRYNLLSLLDLEVEDDDGKKAQESNKTSAKPQSKTLVSKNESCPSCWVPNEVKKWTTKEWKPYERAECNCGAKYFINRK